MSDRRKQYYVVVHGHRPGIYSKWFGVGEAAEQVDGFPEAIYKGFYNREEAINWIKEFPVETLVRLAPNLVELVNEISEEIETLTKTVDELLKDEKVVIFTDGGAITNPGPGGYGTVLRYKERRKELSGGFRTTTNNRMEIFACIAGLKALNHKSDVVIFSDSKYVVDSMKNGWAERWQSKGWMRNKKEKAENSDLWAQLIELCKGHNVEFRWLKGHAGIKDNERCDQLAMDAAQNKGLPADVVYESGESESDTPLFSGLPS